jgi:hypothetical protein
MAKCVRATFSPCKVSRVADDIASKAVSKGMAVYVPKHVWKREVRDNGK